MEKAFIKLKGFLLYCGVLNLCRSFLNGILSYNKVDKCCQLPYSLPLGSSANLTARCFAPGYTVLPMNFLPLDFIVSYFFSESS